MEGESCFRSNERNLPELGTVSLSLSTDSTQNVRRAKQLCTDSDVDSAGKSNAFGYIEQEKSPETGISTELDFYKLIISTLQSKELHFSLFLINKQHCHL